jgi:photosystem II stability/assembly factor-like uncharacterized protein
MHQDPLRPDLGDLPDAATADASAKRPGPSPWLSEHPQPTGNPLRAVWSSGSTAYAVGALGTVVHLDAGAVVSEAEGLTRATLHAVTGVAKEVWAVGDDGVVLHRRDGSWSLQRLGPQALYTVFADGTGKVYAAGQGDGLWQYDGTTWARRSLPGQTAADATYAGVVRGDLIFLLGSGGRILRGDRSGWQRESAGLTDLPFRAVYLRPDGGGYAVGGGGLVARREPGLARWSLDLTALNPPAVELRAVYASNDDVYTVAETGLSLRRAAAGWEPAGSVAPSPVLGGSGDDAGGWAVGAAGQIWHRGPGRSDAWQSALPTPTLTTSDITAITSAGNGALYAVSEDGLILRRVGPSLWQLDGRAPLPQPLYAIWAQGEEAYAVGSGGLVLQRQAAGNWQAVRYNYPDLRPDWRGVWATGSPREVIVVGTAVNPQGEPVAAVLHGTPALAQWEPEPLELTSAPPLYAIAGTGNTVLAVGSSGTVLRRDRTRWVREPSGLGSAVQLLALTALGDDFYATGTRGTLLFRDGRKLPPAWTPTMLFRDGAAVTLSGVVAARGGLWVVGTAGLVGYRATGGDWLTELTPTLSNLQGLAVVDSTLYAVGQGGVILRRGSAPSPLP